MEVSFKGPSQLLFGFGCVASLVAQEKVMKCHEHALQDWKLKICSSILAFRYWPLNKCDSTSSHGVTLVLAARAGRRWNALYRIASTRTSDDSLGSDFAKVSCEAGGLRRAQEGSETPKFELQN